MTSLFEENEPDEEYYAVLGVDRNVSITLEMHVLHHVH